MACSSGETLFPAPNQRVFEESALQGTSAAPWAQPRVVKTIQADVGPGNKTGIYYITVCNLPFGTSWQGLKDFIRDVCKVDHVQVFDTSTSGWVRLCGRHNFEKAWARLDGGYFNGRVIIASDRNRTEPIKIKEPVSAAWTPASPPPPHYVVAPVNRPPAADQHAPRPLIPPTQPRAERQRSANQGPRRIYTETKDRPAAGQAGGVARPLQPDAPDSKRPEPGQYNPQHPAEPRKIYISNIIKTATPEDVAAWIRPRLGVYAAQVAGIEVPRMGLQEIRGHALVVFRKPSAALKAIAILDGEKFQRHEVRVRLAREGVPVSAAGDEPSTAAESPPREASKLKISAKEFVPLTARSKSHRAGKAAAAGSEGRRYASKALVADGSSSRKDTDRSKTR